MLSRRAFGSLMGAAACVGGEAGTSGPAPTVDLDIIPLAAHEAAMRLANRGGQSQSILSFWRRHHRRHRPHSAGAGREQQQDQSGPPRGDRRDQRLCRAPWQPGLGRRHPVHHRRTLPDVHERHRLGRHWGIVYGSSITTLAEASAPEPRCENLEGRCYQSIHRIESETNRSRISRPHRSGMPALRRPAT